MMKLRFGNIVVERGYIVNIINIIWRARRDLNPGPPAPQAGALSWLSYGPRACIGLSGKSLFTFSGSLHLHHRPWSYDVVCGV